MLLNKRKEMPSSSIQIDLLTFDWMMDPITFLNSGTAVYLLPKWQSFFFHLRHLILYEWNVRDRSSGYIKLYIRRIRSNQCNHLQMSSSEKTTYKTNANRASIQRVLYITVCHSESSPAMRKYIVCCCFRKEYPI